MKQPTSESRPAVRIEAENEWAWCGERRLRLTPKVFAVLRHLVEHPDRLITKEELYSAVWGETIVSEATLASCIRDLRKALGDSSRTPRYVQTAHRRGFRFIGPIAASTHRPRRHEPAVAPVARDGQGRGPSVLSTISLLAPLLVGRVAELARLHARLASAIDGQRQLVFVTGEPGIGKTTLVETFLSQIAVGHGPRVARGQCVEQYGAGEAYLPVLEALARWGREPGGERLVQVLTQHAPTWLVQLPALLTDQELHAVQRRAEGSTRERMLRELVEALDVLGNDAPIVLVLEDLHWSDSATIDLLSMLARRREASRLLVVATYRPADMMASGNALRAAKQELQVHGHCDEVPLDFLDVVAVREYLARRFADNRFPDELAVVLHRHTDGSPLFLVNTVDDLVARAQVHEVDGVWELEGAADDVALGAPETLWQVVQNQVERLTADEQAVLAVASVAGAEFSAALASPATTHPHDGESRCDALARRGQFLRAVGVSEWPDGTVAGRYAFIHAFYQSVLYAGVSIGERTGLHLRIGERLERGYRQSTGEIAGELAMHFERGRDFERALQYRRQAGEHALRQHGYREAATHATRALDLLRALPDTERRARLELSFQVMLAAALTATRGYAAPEVHGVYVRIRALCDRVEHTRELYPVLLVLVRFNLIRGALPAARDVARQLLTMAEAAHEPALLLWAHSALGVVAFYAGEFAAALDHLERGIALYDPREHSPEPSRALLAWQDPGVSCLAHSALTHWMLGHPARAAARIHEALTLARTLARPLSVGYACHYAAALHQWRRDHAAMQIAVDGAFEQATQHGFGILVATGTAQRGWLLAEQGQSADGLARMQEGIAALREVGADFLLPGFLASMAGTYERAGRPADGLSSVNEALALVEASGQHYWTAELHRVKGTLTRESDEKAAEASFREAIAIARRQGAKSFELRAATSLGRLRASRGKAAEAHALVSQIYAWFTEGFDTADLIEARALLEELGRADGRQMGARPRRRRA
jgi:DNA-binding winged helix-turn-helix (wHTH) protein/predicted ATPase